MGMKTYQALLAQQLDQGMDGGLSEVPRICWVADISEVLLGG